MDIITITRHGDIRMHARAHTNDIKRRFDGRGHQLGNFASLATDWRLSLPGSNYRAVDLHSVEKP